MIVMRGVPARARRGCSRRRAVAETRWALIVSGASGGEKYAEQMATWRADLQIGAGRSLRVQGRAREACWSTKPARPATSAPRRTCAALFAEIKKSRRKDDFVLMVLLGHGTFDGDVAKFNLVGPDLTANDWTELLDRRAGPRRVVNTTEASFPFLEALTRQGPRRDHRHRLGGAEVRHRVSRLLRQGDQGSVDRSRQERPHLDLRSVRGGQRRGEAALRTARPADHRARAARRQRRRQGPGSRAPTARTAAWRASRTWMPRVVARPTNPELAGSDPPPPRARSRRPKSTSSSRA